jgi:hypothetical protein
MACERHDAAADLDANLRRIDRGCGWGLKTA